MNNRKPNCALDALFVAKSRDKAPLKPNGMPYMKNSVNKTKMYFFSSEVIGGFFEKDMSYEFTNNLSSSF